MKNVACKKKKLKSASDSICAQNKWEVSDDTT
jgi:hypothetical protein